MLSELYKGKLKVCPRCKGHKYIKGQKVSVAEVGHLPDYEHNRRGLCFLCDGTGEVFYTEDNRVLKIVKKNKMNYIIEYSPENGEKIRMLSSFRDNSNSNKIKYNDVKSSEIKDFTSEVEEEDFFPNMYETVWSDWSKVADVIFEEYPNAKPINVNRFDGGYYQEDMSGDCVSFLIYYDELGAPIKPFYIKPSYDFGVEDTSHNGIVMLKNNYVFGVSGTYIEAKKMLYLGVKTKLGFRYYEVSNIKYSPEIKNETLNYVMNTKLSFEDMGQFIKSMSLLILKDLYDMIG